MKFRAEVFDQIQWLFKANGFNDHQLHCLLRFERGLDLALLRQAVAASIAAVPILCSRYVPGANPCWESIDPRACGQAFAVAQTVAELEQFLVSPVDESLGPQLRVCALAAQNFALAFKMNHMVCDAVGFKQYLYLLCESYSGLARDPRYHPATVAGDRSFDGVLATFSLGAKLRSLFLSSERDNLAGEIQFPFSSGGSTQPFFLTRALCPEKVVALKNLGRQRGATLNDVLLAAFYRGLFRQLNLPPGGVLQLPIMVDMRRYLGVGANCSSLTNLSSRVNTELEFRPGEPFSGTVSRVKAVMDERKKNHLGIDSFVQLALLYRFFGGRIARRLLRRKMNNPYLCMTNLGILDAARLGFGGQAPLEAWMCGSLKYRPYLQLAVSIYAGVMTLNVNLAGSAEDRNRMQALLDAVGEELSAAACAEISA
jgi:NRPS condensation-like uncharacterized protein